MATLLSKPVRRKVVLEKAPHGMSKELTVTLYPDGTVGMREARRREEFLANIGQIYVLAVQQTKAAEKAAANPDKPVKRSRLPM